MPVKNNGRYFFTKRQIHQIDRMYDHLRQLHRDAFRELQKIGRSTLTDNRVAAFLRTIADQIIGALQFLAEILSSAQEQVKLVVFEVSPLCSNCPAPPRGPEDNPGTGVPALDPAHLLELDQLLDYAHRIGERSWARGTRHKNLPPALVSGLKRLKNALVKELRHFRETAAAPLPPIEWRENGPDCSVCHQPLKIIDDPMKT